MRLPNLPFWVWPVGGIILIMLVSGVSWLPRFTTASPAYCLSCHGTGETPDRSLTSKVHPGYDRVGCTDCHAKPGILPVFDGYQEGYSADPDRVNANCRRCHSNILKDEQEGFKFNELSVRIPHQFHLELVGAQCTDCHRNVAHELASPATNRPKMDYCFQCHATPQSQSCTKCHPGGLPSVPLARVRG